MLSRALAWVLFRSVCWVLLRSVCWVLLRSVLAALCRLDRKGRSGLDDGERPPGDGGGEWLGHATPKSRAGGAYLQVH